MHGGSEENKEKWDESFSRARGTRKKERQRAPPPFPTRFSLTGRASVVVTASVSDLSTLGLVRKRGDTAMRELFFHLNKKFGKMIKKTWQYMFNVILHIYSSINFCVRTLVFFIIEENRIFWMYEINRFFTINSLFFVQICPK